MKKFWKILKTLFRNAYIRDSKIPGFVTSNFAFQILDIIITIIFFNVIFANTMTVGGWNFYQILFLYALAKVIAQINSAFFKKGVNTFATEMIRLGDYDFYMLKPFNSMVLTSISKPRPYALITCNFYIGIMVYALIYSGITITWVNICWFIFLTIIGVFLWYFLKILTVIPSFWFVRITSVTDLMDRMAMLIRYPTGVYPRLLTIILSTIFPIILITYFPAKTLFYTPEVKYIAYMIFITILFGYLTKWLWRLGEKSYGSASS